MPKPAGLSVWPIIKTPSLLLYPATGLSVRTVPLSALVVAWILNDNSLTWKTDHLLFSPDDNPAGWQLDENYF
jgi:hypothetical protein